MSLDLFTIAKDAKNDLLCQSNRINNIAYGSDTIDPRVLEGELLAAKRFVEEALTRLEAVKKEKTTN